jgi:integrase
MAAKVRCIDGVWWVVVHHQGRRRKKRIGKDKRAAEEVARQIQARLVLGQFDVHRRDEKAIPFREFAEDWLRREVEIPIERGQKGHLAPGTSRVYRLQVDLHLTPYFGDTDVRKIGRREVQALCDHFTDTGRPRSAKSVDMVLNVLRLILAHAQAQEIVEANAVKEWKARRPRRRSSSSARVPRSKVLSGEELGKLIEETRKKFPRFLPLILFLADTGARFGEAVALRWIDVDLEAGTARIARSFSSGQTLGPTKTGRVRTVELSTRLRSALFEIQPNVFPPPEDSLVFPNRKGGFLFDSLFRSRVFSKIVAGALGEGRHYSPHCLRHTWASLHMARGTPLKWIQAQGGWTTAKVLLDTYGHYLPEESRGFADALSATSNGPPAAPGFIKVPKPLDYAVVTPRNSSGPSSTPSSTGPRSPIMHLTEPPPFLRNSETSTVTGVTPRSRIWPSRWSETPAGISSSESPPCVRVKEFAA